jgi:hypothetical protein
MRSVLIVAAAMLGSCPARVSAQEDGAPIPYSLQEDAPRVPDMVREFDFRSPRADRSADLWYGTPGVRPGGDLLGPILSLVRKPSGLLDFRPRNIPSWLPDRETAELLRERR